MGLLLCDVHPSELESLDKLPKHPIFSERQKPLINDIVSKIYLYVTDLSRQACE